MSNVVKKKKKISPKKKKRKSKSKDKKESKLNVNEQLFCQLYFKSGEFFGNGVWSYVKAFNLDLPCFTAYSYLTKRQKNIYTNAKSAAYHLMTKSYIIKEGDKILKETFTEVCIDKELNKVIAQDRDKVSKVMAIKEFNQLKNRIIKKIDHSTNGKDIQPIINIYDYPESIKN